MTLDTRPTLTIAEVASVAAQVEDIDGAVAELDAELLIVYLRRLEQVTEVVGKWKRAIETRLVLDERVGEHWKDTDGHTYAFLRSSRGDFADPQALFADLMTIGKLDALTIAAAVSKVRVTDLRTAAAEIKDDERRVLVLDLIEEHRTKIQGAPRLVDLDNKFLKSALAAKK